MSSDDAEAEADRILRICAACMYCDGLCPVFPAIAGKHGFTPTDLSYLANLCHNCRGCWYACQYAAPHPFAVNVPATLATVRRQSYASLVWPKLLGVAFRRPFHGAVLAVAAALTALLLLRLVGGDRAAWLGAHTGSGAFYAVAPWALMAGLAGACLSWAIFSLIASMIRFWRFIVPDVPRAVFWSSFAPALRDIVTLRHLDGGGPGCNDVDMGFSRTRRLFHHVMVSGLLLDVAATVTAAFYQEALAVFPPFAYVSIPVVAGAVGGVAIVVGACGLLALEFRAEREPSERTEAALNVVFLLMLTIVAASGLALLALRDTTAMSPLLVFHLSFVLGLFVALPATKLIHAPFRAAALLRYAAEQEQKRRIASEDDGAVEAE